MSQTRNFRRLPGQIENFEKLNDELDSIIKQVNLFSSEVIKADTSKDLFEIQKYNRVLKINRDAVTLGELADFVATMAIKLGELGLIKTEKRN